MTNCCVTDDVGPTILIFVMRLLLVLFFLKKKENQLFIKYNPIMLERNEIYLFTRFSISLHTSKFVSSKLAVLQDFSEQFI